MTDNGACYRSQAFRDACKQLGLDGNNLLKLHKGQVIDLIALSDRVASY